MNGSGGFSDDELTAVRQAQRYLGGLAHPSDPDAYEPGMTALAARARDRARAALLAHVGRWLGQQIIQADLKDFRPEDRPAAMNLSRQTLWKMETGKQVPTIHSVIEAKWLSGEWGAIPLPPRWEVYSAMFNSTASEVVIPVLGAAGHDRKLPTGPLSAAEVETLGCLEHYEAEFAAARRALRGAAGGVTPEGFARAVRRHLVSLFGDDLPRDPRLGFGPPNDVTAAFERLYDEWEFVSLWVNELLERHVYRPFPDPVPGLEPPASPRGRGPDGRTVNPCF